MDVLCQVHNVVPRTQSTALWQVKVDNSCDVKEFPLFCSGHVRHVCIFLTLDRIHNTSR